MSALETPRLLTVPGSRHPVIPSIRKNECAATAGSGRAGLTHVSGQTGATFHRNRRGNRPYDWVRKYPE